MQMLLHGGYTVFFLPAESPQPEVIPDIRQPFPGFQKPIKAEVLMQVLIDGGQGHPVFGSRQLHVEPGSPIGTHILIDAGGPQNIPGAIESNLPPEKVGEGFTVALEEELVQLTNLQRMQRPKREAAPQVDPKTSLRLRQPSLRIFRARSRRSMRASRRHNPHRRRPRRRRRRRRRCRPALHGNQIAPLTN